MIKKSLSFCFGLLLCALSTSSMANQTPKEIKIMVQYSAGGSADRVARVIESAIDKNRYRVQIEYKLGAGGGIAHAHMATLKTPGETVLLVAGPSLVSLPILNPSTNAYDPSTDFVTVAHLGTEPSVIVVNSQTGIKNWQDFVTYTKTREVNYGSSGLGGAGHTISALVAGDKSNFVHIPYKGPAIADLLGGQLTYLNESAMLLDQHISSGKLVPVAVGSPTRVDAFKNVPTLQELKINDHQYYRWSVLIANRGADPEVLQYIRTLSNSAEVQRELKSLYMTPAKDFSPAEFLKEEKRKFLIISKQLNLPIQ